MHLNTKLESKVAQKKGTLLLCEESLATIECQSGHRFKLTVSSVLSHGAWCRECAKAKKRKQAIDWHYANRQKALDRLRASRDPAKERNNRLKKLYDLSPEQYEAMAKSQQGVCAICNEPPVRWLCVDHCHNTGKIRGLLCDACNTAIGLLNDDVARLKKAEVYLANA